MNSHFTAIPVIDISGLSGNAGQKQTVVENLGHAARTIGFMYITGHGMEPSLFANMLRETKTFFDLPIEEKMSLYIGKSSNHRGYVPQGEEVFSGGSKDLKEAFDLSLDLPSDDPDYIAGNPLIGPNQWPAIPHFREIITDYYNAVFNVGRHLMSAFAVALGLSADAFEASLTKPPSQLRLIHYPYDPTAHDVAGIGAHTDFECFTLLRATAPGLEVMNGQGEWIDAPPIENAFIVNIGDMLELLSGGEFIATSHRVRKVKEERYSFPLFFSLDYDVRVQPLPGRENPALPTQSLVAGEHLFAQTAQIFTYLKQRLADGTLVLPESSLALSSFGQESRHPNS